MDKKKILFICTNNSSRSQMTEGLMRSMFGDRFEAFSAGTRPTEVNPFAVKAMKEIGIDISKHRSKSVNEFLDKKFDYIVTVCSSAKETCPFFPGGSEYIHMGFEDPAEAKGSDKEKLNSFIKINFRT